MDIQLSSIIPAQKNLAKTYMWLSALIIGGIFAIGKSLLDLVSNPFCIEGYLLVFIAISALALLLLSVFAVLSAFLKGSKKTFGHIDIAVMSTIEQDKYEHVVGLNKMLEATRYAFENNSKVIESRAKDLRASLILCAIGTLFSIIFISISIGINLYGKEVKNMSNDKLAQQRPVASAQDGQKPSAALQTNNYEKIHESNNKHESTRSGHNITSSDKSKSEQNRTDKK